MTKGKFLRLFVFVVIIVFTPVAAYSQGIIDLPLTGQASCYCPDDGAGGACPDANCSGGWCEDAVCASPASPPGQDGHLMMGTAWPSPRFAVNAGPPDNGNTITDNLTGLMWTTNANVWGCSRNWQNAMNLIAGLNYAGHADWRMPNMRELESLFYSGFAEAGNCGGPGCATLAAWLNTQGFTNVQSALYWTSTEYLDNAQADDAWALSFATADYWLGWNIVNNAKNLVTHCTLPVRDSGSSGTVSLPKTGADNCSNPAWSWDSDGACNGSWAGETVQDGFLQKGAAWTVAARFTDNLDGTVTDNLTGLTWTRDGSMELAMNADGLTSDLFQGALQFVDDMNTQANGRCIPPPVDQGSTNCNSPPICAPPAPVCVRISNSPLQFECRGTGDTSCTTDADCDTVNGETCVFIPNYGTTDWRLPNLYEMRSLIVQSGAFFEAGFWNPAPNPDVFDASDKFLTIHGPFVNAATPNRPFGYWTSTTDPANPGQAYSILLASSGGGGIIPTALHIKNNPPGGFFAGAPRYVWPVRSDDDDGVDTSIEDNAPNNGDGNGDGIRDVFQPEVTSLPSATGQGYITVVTPPIGAGGCGQNLNVQTTVETPDDPLYTFPWGMVRFDLPCPGPVQVTIIFHGTSDLSGAEYRKNGPMAPAFGAPQWYPMPGVVFGTTIVGGQTVATATFTLTDGIIGDGTGVDGTIFDPGGPAILAPPVAVPTMTGWGIAVFMILVLIGTVYYVRRKRTV